MVSGDGDVCGSVLDHAEERTQNASDGADFAAVGVTGGGYGIVMPEQLVRAVDEVDFQNSAPGQR